MKVKLDPGAKMPTRAHQTDAGLDLYAMDTQIVSAKESATFDTGGTHRASSVYRGNAQEQKRAHDARHHQRRRD